MKITVQSGDYTYSYDDSCRTRVVDGFEEAGYTDVEGAVNAGLELLTVCFSRREIAKVIKDQKLEILFEAGQEEQEGSN